MTTELIELISNLEKIHKNNRGIKCRILSRIAIHKTRKIIKNQCVDITEYRPAILIAFAQFVDTAKNIYNLWTTAYENNIAEVFFSSTNNVDNPYSSTYLGRITYTTPYTEMQNLRTDVLAIIDDSNTHNPRNCIDCKWAITVKNKNSDLRDFPEYNYNYSSRVDSLIKRRKDDYKSYSNILTRQTELVLPNIISIIVEIIFDEIVERYG